MSEKILGLLPEMESGEQLIEDLTVLPEYDPSICSETQSRRLTALSDLYKIYLPSRMSLEIYDKLYLALYYSVQRKDTKHATKLRNDNYKGFHQPEYNGIMGGADSFTIFGESGIGKSSAVNRAISLIAKKRVFEIKNPYTKIIPCLIVQCPFDSSIKSLLLEILRKVDESLGTNYYQNALKSRNATTDVLIGSVSTIALNHIGVLIVDEIQNVSNSRNGKSLIGALTQMINDSDISICMIGTPDCMEFFGSAMQLARRSVGLHYSALDFDEYFKSVCRILFQYQYVREYAEITDEIINWLYEHSSGLISVVISLIHDAQEIAILSGGETLTFSVLNKAYKDRLSLLNSYIKPSTVTSTRNYKPKRKDVDFKADDEIKEDVRLADLVNESKSEGKNIVDLLREYYQVIEV